MQTLVPDKRAAYRNVFDALGRILRTEGLRSAMKGVDATAYGAGPAHAVYFAMYEYLKKTLSRGEEHNHIARGISLLFIYYLFFYYFILFVYFFIFLFFIIFFITFTL